MSSYTGNIAFAPLRSALVNLPGSAATAIFNSNIPAQNVVLELVWDKGGIKGGESHAFVGWTGMSSRKVKSGDSLIEIDPSFALQLGIAPDQKVTVKIQANTPRAHTVHLEPLTSSDWEIVEIHAQFLEHWMINQVRAISTLHPITVYPSQTSIASLKVIKIEPEPENGPFPYAQLSPDSEVIIAPKVRKKQTKDKSRKTPSTTGKKKSDSKSGSNQGAILRGVPLPHRSFGTVGSAQGNEEGDAEPKLDMTVYADPDAVLYPLRGAEYVTVSVIQPSSISSNQNAGGPTPPASGGNADGSSPQQELTPATSVVARLAPYMESPEGHVGLSAGVSCALKIVGTVGPMIRLEPAPKPTKNVKEVVVHPYTTSTTPNSLKFNEKKENGEQEGAKNGKVQELLESAGFFASSNPITTFMQIPALDDILPQGALVELNDADAGSGSWIKGGNISIKVGSDVLRPESTIPPTLQDLYNSSANRPRRKVVGIDKQLQEIEKAVCGSTSGTLIYGTRGAGKTVVAREIEQALQENCIHPIWFSCGAHGEKQLQYLKETVRKLFLEAAWYAPSVVIFDDIEKLIPAEVEHRDSTKSVQLAEIFNTLAKSIMQSRPVSVIATAPTKESIHGSLITSHLFEETFHLKSPDKDIREVILREAVQSLGLTTDEDFDLLEVAGSTEGYQPSDLWTLVERANHQSILRSIENSTKQDQRKVDQSHFDAAMEDFVPSSLRGVKLQKSGASWDDIGGLKETKNILLETLEWPTKYAPIFANCPLRLRSGLLLYGYPGCGKTLLASAVAAQSGLNFISIKGPEILNKYIGASEQSVRDLFDRAQAAKPCILFFDEFDSIAPKRGHDSTGVTDRVVNQMLTQMDGAEGLDGVYVLAATSRPDLIDSALLRPGRLDKSLICDMPNFDDRMDILNAIQKKMKISPEVRLEDIAERTDGYSGADLQALLYNAYLGAIHDVVDVTEDAEDAINGDDGDDSERLEYFQTTIDGQMSSVDDGSMSAAERAKVTKKLEKLLLSSKEQANAAAKSDPKYNKSADDVVIEPRHVEQSLSDTKPSISASERRKLEAIYHQFVSGRSGDMPDGSASTDIGGRATLM